MLSPQLWGPGRGQLRIGGVGLCFLDNPAVPSDLYTLPSSSATSTPTQQLQEPPSLAWLAPVSPSSRRVEFNHCSCACSLLLPPQGRRIHHSLNHGISSPSHIYLVEGQEDSLNPLKPPTCTPNPGWHRQPAAAPPWVPTHYYHPHCEWNLITTQAKQLAGPPASRETKWRQKEGQPWGRF